MHLQHTLSGSVSKPWEHSVVVFYPKIVLRETTNIAKCLFWPLTFAKSSRHLRDSCVCRVLHAHTNRSSKQRVRLRSPHLNFFLSEPGLTTRLVECRVCTLQQLSMHPRCSFSAHVGNDRDQHALSAVKLASDFVLTPTWGDSVALESVEYIPYIRTWRMQRRESRPTLSTFLLLVQFEHYQTTQSLLHDKGFLKYNLSSRFGRFCKEKAIIVTRIRPIYSYLEECS